jgi:hypothetical protein
MQTNKKEESYEGYEGYQNYETWQVSLFINNDEPAYNRVQAKIKRYLEFWNDDKEKVIKSLATWLRPVLSSVIKRGRRKINWIEIATDEVEVVLEDQRYTAEQEAKGL